MRGSIFVRSGGEDGECFRTAMDHAACVGARNRTAQIRRGYQRIHGFIGKPVRQDLAQAIAKLFAVHAPRFAARGRPRQIRVARGANGRTGRLRRRRAPRDSSARRTTRRTRLCCALHRCSSAASPWARTSYCTPSSAASHSPFSRTSGAPVEAHPVEGALEFRGQFHEGEL